MSKSLILAGKDYFTVEEAADYAGISYSHWRAKVQGAFPPGTFYGKLLYRRADVQRFIEQHARWPQSIPGENAGISTGRKTASRDVSRSGESPSTKPTSGEKRKKLSLVPASESSSPQPSSKPTSSDT
jgi:hypothetical protein